MSPKNVDDALSELLAALDDAGLEFSLVGGYAVVTWGIPCATYDVDVLVEHAPSRMTDLFDACERRGFIVDDSYRSGWRDRIGDMLLAKVQLYRDDRAVTCDVFPVATEFQESAFARRQAIDVPTLGRAVAVITAADLLLFKFMANRPKDRLDARNILIVQGIPDETYLREWARRLHLEDRLARALDDAGLSSDTSRSTRERALDRRGSGAWR